MATGTPGTPPAGSDPAADQCGQPVCAANMPARADPRAPGVIGANAPCVRARPTSRHTRHADRSAARRRPPPSGRTRAPRRRASRGCTATGREWAFLRPGGAGAAVPAPVVDVFGGKPVGTAVDGEERDHRVGVTRRDHPRWSTATQPRRVRSGPPISGCGPLPRAAGAAPRRTTQPPTSTDRSLVLRSDLRNRVNTDGDGDARGYLGSPRRGGAVGCSRTGSCGRHESRARRRAPRACRWVGRSWPSWSPRRCSPAPAVRRRWTRTTWRSSNVG